MSAHYLGLDRDLAVGDLIAIQYRSWNDDCDGSASVERWIRARVVDCEPGTWPLARLDDGQMTEVRPYMTWRTVSKAHAARSQPRAA